MKILFLTMVRIDDVLERGIYTDLIRKFKDMGHEILIACPIERRFNKITEVKESYGIKILSIETLNIQKTNLIEKGIGMILLETQFLKAIKKYFSKIKFDLVIYSTPPITFTRIIKYIKGKDGAKSYLLLKDIFPQNAVDLKMISENGFLHKYFKRREKNLYKVSDYIGCMSPKNKEYLLRHNKYIDVNTVDINPNSISPVSTSINNTEKIQIRAEYNIPTSSTVFIYGGNLGKPQGIDFLMEILSSNKDKEGIFFLIVGDGTDYRKIQTWFEKIKPNNALLIPFMERRKYDRLLSSSDVGLIFLDKRFTIPNFPSRLLNYLECKLPVLAATDEVTDLGKIMMENNFGYRTLFGDLRSFNEQIDNIQQNPNKRNKMGENGFNFMIDNYDVLKSYEIIIKKIINV